MKTKMRAILAITAGLFVLVLGGSASRVAAKENSPQLGAVGPQGEVDVAGGRSREIRDLTPHPDVRQDRIRLEQVLQIGVELRDLENVHQPLACLHTVSRIKR